MTDTKFNPKDHVMDMRGKQYLEVKWRIVWFRGDHPKGGIVTELANVDPVVMKATVIDADGKVLSTGYGTPKKQGVASSRPFEGAETAAIGRALAVAGYGTQFTGEDEEEHIADSPVEKKAPAEPIWTVAQRKALIDAKLANNDFAAKGMLGLSNLPAEATNDEIVSWGKVYRENRYDDEGKNKMTSAEAAEIANKKAGL